MSPKTVWEKIINRNIREIADDIALRYYGAALGLGYFITFVDLLRGRTYRHLSNAVEPICWPVFPNCGDYRFLSLQESKVLVWVFGLLGLSFTVCFLFKRIRWGYFLLWITALSEIGIVLQDFMFRQNQHYMLLWTTFVYLLVPNKREAIRFLIVAFYFWAGRLKLNHEWISGAVLYNDLWPIPRPLWPAACVYVIVLELVLIWGVLSRRPGWFWATLFQLALFHLMSFNQVGFFYPVLMSSILAIYPLCQFFPGSQAGFRDLIALKLRPATYLVLIWFSILQMIPMFYDGSPDLTGQGRFFGLHMFQARQRCEVYADIKLANGKTSRQDLKWYRLRPRIICEPVIYFNRAKNMCRKIRQNSNFIDLDFTFKIARTTDPELQTLVDVKDFCRQNPQLNLIFANDWIRPIK